MLGDKNFTEEYILGALYQQALAGQGLQGHAEGQHRLLGDHLQGAQTGQIQMYPEYTGTLLTAIAGDNKPPEQRAADATPRPRRTPRSTASRCCSQTPFYDSDAPGRDEVLRAQNSLHTIADLKKLGNGQARRAAPSSAPASTASSASSRSTG